MPSAEPVEPIQVDLARVLVIGTTAWGVALVVCVILAAAGRTSWLPVAVCAVAAGLGLLGVVWSHHHDTMGHRLPRR
ncbi:MAG: DUF2530 domain-containing protein [Micrococcales bacterium]|nr:DUF2530 domain-containing protein [Micrococcales bacterium]